MSTLTESTEPTGNRILDALTPEEHERLHAYLEPVTMTIGEILYHPDEPITHVYFPKRGTVSIVSTFENGLSVEVGMVGNEGMFGVGVFLGSVSTQLEVQVQLPGEGFRMRADALKREFKKCG
jgi:CRP-like cAMP-binding protein